MRLPLLDSPSEPTVTATEKVAELLKFRQDKSEALKEILRELTEYEGRQDARMKDFLDYSQQWIAKQKELANG